MPRSIHFLSGLPRSGSTLLAALLSQNPLIRADMSSPLAVMVEKLLPVMGTGEYAGAFGDPLRRRVLHSLVDGFLGPDEPEHVAIDTNRAWCAHMRLIADLYPDAVVIACVRDPVWIIDSFEQLVRRNTYSISGLHGVAHAATVFDRVERLMAVTGAFGAAWQALQDAFFGEHAHRLVVVDYDALVAEPLRVLALLYDRLSLTAFAHDPGNVPPVDAAAFDAHLHTPGLHTLRPTVGRIHRRTILPPQIVSRLADTAFWRDETNNPGGAFVIGHD
ncbi:sulfotransferase [Acetobacteraceae bacterium KSS8]|uniref:Sulfotransferase n=1 Tax=Endosaccharibacter trunci TaxID=2812733 RepID=A0ABT1W3W5_9PROT|nr:sulfotransferase [Acetobacteraceae bacterium KSS8]